MIELAFIFAIKKLAMVNNMWHCLAVNILHTLRIANDNNDAVEMVKNNVFDDVFT